MRSGHHSLEAPTHLRSHQLALSPECLTDDDNDGEPVTAKAEGSGQHRLLEVVSARLRTERSQVAPAVTAPGRKPVGTPVPPSASVSHKARPLASPPATPSAARAPLPAARVVEARSSSSSSSSKSRSSSSKSSASASGSSSRSRRESAAPLPPQPKREATQAPAQKSVAQGTPVAPAPVAVAPVAPVAPAAVQMPQGFGAFDPMQVPVPPELAGPIYTWVRRLALQADLAGADRVLRDALLDTSSSLSVSVIYPGQDGLWSLGGDEEVPADPTPLVAVAQARKAMIASHMAIIPVLTSTETVAVLVINRNPRNPGYHPVEQIAMIALARECAATLHHLMVGHLQHQREVAQDSKSLYRGEALEAHRNRGTEGEVVNLSPVWVRRAYPLLLGALLIGIVASIMMRVNTYSSGVGLVTYAGKMTTSPAGGTVAKVYIKAGTQVQAGTILAKLDTAQEEVELGNAKTEYDNIVSAFLSDQNDDQVKSQLASAAARVEKAAAIIKTKTIRARDAGVVGEIKIKEGDPMQPGAPVAFISPVDSAPEVTAFLPGNDRPRIHEKMLLMVTLNGYQMQPLKVEIIEVAPELVGGNDIGRYVGASLADSLGFNQKGSTQYVKVVARLPRTFKVEKTERPFFHGMSVKAEIKVNTKPFLASLLPVLEKYLPD